MVKTSLSQKSLHEPSLVSLTLIFNGVVNREFKGRSTGITIFSRKFGLDGSGYLEALVEALNLRRGFELIQIHGIRDI